MKTATKTSALDMARISLKSSLAHLRQARDDMDDSYAERLAILEAEVEAVMDGLKRVHDGD